MKCTHVAIISLSLLALCSCSMSGVRQATKDAVVQPAEPLTLPIGKNWQVVEEPPKLNDGRRLPFQTEQSVQPAGAQKPVTPTDNRSIETIR